MIFSVHIPKTAGTSFRMALEERYGEKLALYYGVQDPKTTGSLRVPLGQLAARVEALQAEGVEVLHGHFTVTSVKPLITDPSRQLWTWLRDPVERTVSQFDFYRERKLDLAKLAGKVKSGEILLKDFVRLRSVRDIQSHYLRGVDLSEFGFVGITERFELGLALLFGAEAPQLKRRYNATDERSQTRAPMRAHLLRANAQDMALYAEGLRLFVDRLAAASDIEAPKRPTVAGSGLIKRLARKVA